MCHSGLAYDTCSVLSHVLCSHVVGVLFAEAVLPFLAVETEGIKGIMFLLVRHLNRCPRICVWMNTALLGS